MNPLVLWLWVAGLIIALGALVATAPLPRAAGMLRARRPAGDSDTWPTHTRALATADGRHGRA